MAVDQTLAAVLKSDASYVGVNSPSFDAWSATGAEMKAVTPFSALEDAEREALRTAAFLAGPTVRDKVVVPGQRCDLIGRPLRIHIATGELGYGDAVPVFVIGAEERESDTALTVLRRLG